MPEVVAPIEARPPRFGLVASARLIDVPSERWQDTFTHLPEASSSGRVGKTASGGSDTIDPDCVAAAVTDESFLIWAGDSCSVFDLVGGRDWEARVRRILNATQSYEIAAELWGGSLGLEGRSLNDPASDRLTTSAVAATVGLACVEQGLAACGHGQPGMVHMTPSVLTTLVADGALSLAGNTYTTPNGHVVVPDAGYPGTGPLDENNSGTQWIYGTSLIALRMAPVEVVPGSLTEAKQIAAGMDRAVNTLTAWAQRVVAWQWDELCHVAAEVSVPLCTLGGAS